MSNINIVNAKTSTTNFQMTSGATNGYVLTSDSNGNATWQLVTNTFTTGATLNGNILEFDRNDLSNAYSVDLSPLQFTGNTSGDCVNDLYVSNIHSCSPLNINPLDEGNIYFGSTSGVTIDLTNNRVGIGTNTPSEKLEVDGNTIINGTLTLPAGTTTDPSLILTDGGTLLTSPQIGAFEFLGTSLYFTDFNGVRRNILLAQSGFTASTVNELQDTEVSTVSNGETWYYDGGLWRNTNIISIDNNNVKATIDGDLDVSGNTIINGSLNIGAILSGTPIINLGLDSSGNVVTGGTFTGNTSGDCITDLYVSNLYGCSPITVNDSVQSVTSSATGATSFAFGFQTNASGNYSHAEGRETNASGGGSHAEGRETNASGNYSHAEGNSTTASGGGSHAEGSETNASGNYSHAQGLGTTASGIASFASGINSIAQTDGTFIHSQNSLVTGQRSVVLGGQNITGSTNDTVFVPYLNINNLGTGTSINNIGIDSNGFVVTGITSTDFYVTGGTLNNNSIEINRNDSSNIFTISGTSGININEPATGIFTIESTGGGGGGGTTQATGLTISFTSKEVYNTPTSPGTGNISDDLTGSQLGIVQKIYHNSGSVPTVPAGWVLLGDGIYFTSQLNIIYAEWVTGSRVEYWIVQEQ